MTMAHVCEERFQHGEAYKALLRAKPMLRKLSSPLISELDKRIGRITKLMTLKEIKRMEEEAQEESGGIPLEDALAQANISGAPAGGGPGESPPTASRPTQPAPAENSQETKVTDFDEDLAAFSELNLDDD